MIEGKNIERKLWSII